MKRLAKILGGFFVFVILIIAFVFYLTGDMVSSVDEFFSKVKAREFQGAYDDLASGFKANTSLDQLKSFLRSTSLDKYQSASWSSRSFENTVGKLEGSITTESGAVVPLLIQMVKEGGKWKIYGIRKASSGA